MQEFFMLKLPSFSKVLCQVLTPGFLLVFPILITKFLEYYLTAAKANPANIYLLKVNNPKETPE